MHFIVLAGPKQRAFHQEILQAKQAGVGAQAKRISSRNSTSKASWGWRRFKKNVVSLSAFLLLDIKSAFFNENGISMQKRLDSFKLYDNN